MSTLSQHELNNKISKILTEILSGTISRYKVYINDKNDLIYEGVETVTDSDDYYGFWSDNEDVFFDVFLAYNDEEDINNLTDEQYAEVQAITNRTMFEEARAEFATMFEYDTYVKNCN